MDLAPLLAESKYLPVTIIIARVKNQLAIPSQQLVGHLAIRHHEEIAQDLAAVGVVVGV